MGEKLSFYRADGEKTSCRLNRISTRKGNRDGEWLAEFEVSRGSFCRFFSLLKQPRELLEAVSLLLKLIVYIFCA